MAKDKNGTGAPKNPVGRPNIYRNTFYTRNPERAGQADEYTPNTKAWEHLAKLINKGLTNEQLAAVYDVDEVTIYDWQNKYDDFSNALEIHKRRYDDGRVVQSLYERANGWRGKETKAFVIGGKLETIEVIKHFPPDTSAIGMWLYNRQPELWRAISHIDYTSKTPPPPMEYDYEKLTDEELEMFEYLLNKMATDNK